MSELLVELDALLRNLDPELHDGVFVYACVPRPAAAALREAAIAFVREAEGDTLVLEESQAQAAGLDVSFRAAWITLRVHSALHAVGLTAAVSQRLAAAGISCNVIAGARHDHLLVPVERAADAMVELSRGLA